MYKVLVVTLLVLVLSFIFVPVGNRNLWGELTPIIFIGVSPDLKSARGMYYTALACNLQSYGYYPIFENIKPFEFHENKECEKIILKLYEEHKTALLQISKEKSPIMIYPHWTTKTNLQENGKKYLYVVFENEKLPNDHLEMLKSFDGFITASNYNKKLLENLLPSNSKIFVSKQGILTEIYKPYDRNTNFKESFVIYSSGKLEFRKSQDIVISAFKRFKERNPLVKAHLIGVWGNQWENSIQTMLCSNCVSKIPKKYENSNSSMQEYDFKSWLIDNGLPEDSFTVYNYLKPQELSNLHKNISIAIYPNRCESGTNMFAAETLSSGIPTIMSNTTGHSDLLNLQHKTGKQWVFSLNNLKNVSCYSFPSMKLPGSWFEPLVEEIVEKMEYIYLNEEEAKKIGKRASEVIKFNHSSKNSTNDFVQALEQLLE